MASHALKIMDGGDLVVPSGLRQALGVEAGDTVIVDVVDGALHVRPVNAAVRNAQRLVRQYIPEGVSLVDDLIADRRAEAVREETGG